ncbi:MAG: UDP-glucose 4-epimerase GalE [Acidobacteria bacterium]|nr:UDP-glucose 4-epimerase GalE [Acidobacteriota bacterium]MBI3487880.1 UDP-glucose 4-epimerase GalE [Acidobacteriota bacterium]
MGKSILVTGGAGFIGSHTVVELIARGHHPLVYDNLCNASPLALERVREITGKEIPFVEGDIRDRSALDGLFRARRIDAVIHFAGLKAVGESIQVPLAYYDNNLTGTVHLLEAMREAGCRNLIFSSSATVYGDPERTPVTEDMPLSATNPYGRSKLIIEDICRDLARSEEGWHIALLRYFNPVGAHPSGRIGEDPGGIPNNLMPYLLQVAAGRLPELRIFGADYPTPDGTGVRDFIHVVDLARGHIAALEALETVRGAEAFNLGTGRGHSVLEVLRAMERSVGAPIPHRFAPRRPGDIACCYAAPALAEQRLDWKAELGLETMCADAWRWAQGNPGGFGP